MGELEKGLAWATVGALVAVVSMTTYQRAHQTSTALAAVPQAVITDWPTARASVPAHTVTALAIAAPASSLPPLPPGWKLDTPTAPDELVWFRGRRIPFQMAQAAMRAEAAEQPQSRLDSDGARAIVEFNEKVAARHQAQDDMRQVVRDELRREALLRGDQ